MYRTVFTPTELNSMISLNVPREWYGRDVEVIAFPCDMPAPLCRAAKGDRRKPAAIPFRYSFSTKDFKFNRDEANDYE